MLQIQRVTIDTAGIADMLGIPTRAIIRHRCGQIDHPLLRGLPDPVMERPRLVWLVDDINDWLASRRTFRPADAQTPAPTPARRGPGRPRTQAEGGAA